ncbi:hypothetical protein OEZ73_27375, partial [Leclercia adecarboxylata]
MPVFILAVIVTVGEIPPAKIVYKPVAVVVFAVCEFPRVDEDSTVETGVMEVDSRIENRNSR